MKEKINVTEYAGAITEVLPRGILLCTDGDKFNAMVIGWGALGVCWSVPTFTVYVRENRYTKGQLDRTGEFTICVPLEKPDPRLPAFAYAFRPSYRQGQGGRSDTESFDDCHAGREGISPNVGM